MEIKSISQKIFGTNIKKESENSANHTNPFGVSFNGNIISADVFESSQSKPEITFKGAELAARAAGRCKMTMSNAIGSINKFMSAVGERLNQEVNFGIRLDGLRDFGKSVREGAGKAWNYITTRNLVINIGTSERTRNIFAVKMDRQNPYLGNTVESLSSDLKEALAERAAISWA